MSIDDLDVIREIGAGEPKVLGARERVRALLDDSSRPLRFRRRGVWLGALVPAAAVAAALVLVLVTGGGEPAERTTADERVESVATVGERVLTTAAFDHWMVVAARSSKQRSVPSPGTKRWRGLRDQVMQFLISAEWIEGEAAERGVVMTVAETERAFAKRKRDFKTEADFQVFKEEAGYTDADLLMRIRLDQLSNRLRKKVTAGAKHKQAALDRFVKRFRARWKARTTCAPAYRVADCGQ